MYSVLIMNQKTKEAFREFQPLFLEALGSQVGCCKWMEHGGTVDTALPTLRTLIENRDEWRAIIVRVEDGAVSKKYRFDKKNPYDFEINNQKNSEASAENGSQTTSVENENSVEENLEEQEEAKIQEIGLMSNEEKVAKYDPVPLIRLTHMLGGIPAPEIQYKRVKIEEESKAPRYVYTPLGRDKAQMFVNEELGRHYDYDGKRPTEIIVVTLRDVSDIRRMPHIAESWSNKQERDSSAFWKRNAYPGKCRFVVYDFERQGHIQKEADMFKFWCSILLLSTNIIDSSSLQAYRLYTINTIIDKKLLEQSIQDKVIELARVRTYINEEIKKDHFKNKKNGPEDEEQKKASYACDVAIPHTSGGSAASVDSSLFKLTNRRSNSGEAEKPETDFDRWDREKNTAETGLAEMFRAAERSLEKSSDDVRHSSQVSEREVKPADRFELEDIETDLKKRYSAILEAQTALPNPGQYKTEDMDEAAEAARDYIYRRVKTKTMWLSFAHVALGCLLMFLPAVILYARFDFGHIVGAGIYFGGTLLLMLLTIVLALVFQKHEFVKLIRAYNAQIELQVERLEANLQQFTDYATNITSYTRGRRYLWILKNKNALLEEEHSLLFKHYRISEKFLEKLEHWSKGFYLDIDFDIEANGNYIYNTKTDPCKDVMYTLEMGEEYQVPVNETGEYVVAPFDFISKLEIRREELYD